MNGCSTGSGCGSPSARRLGRRRPACRRGRMPARKPLLQRLQARLSAIDLAGLRRTLRPPSGIDLSSNDYLALARDPRIVAALMAGAAREGAGSTGSRLLRGERDAFTAVEARF